jgi:hypothetical protein
MYEPSELEFEILQNEVEELAEQKGYTLNETHQILHREIEASRRDWELDLDDEDDEEDDSYLFDEDDIDI